MTQGVGAQPTQQFEVDFSNLGALGFAAFATFGQESGAAATGATKTVKGITFRNPLFGYTVTDISDASSDFLAQGDSKMLPVFKSVAYAEGKGQPCPFYGYVFGQSTTADSGFSQSNLVGGMIGGQIGPSDTHSGIWGINALALSLRTDQNLDFQMFGIEANVFNDWKDSGTALPQATWFKCGIASTSSGNYPIHVGLLSTFANGTTAQSPTTGNRPHVGLLVSDAIDYGIVIGDVSASAVVPGGPLKAAVGLQLSERGVSSGSGGSNYDSLILQFNVNYATGASTSAENSFQILASPNPGVNPLFMLKFIVPGSTVATLDSTGVLTAIKGFNVPNASGTALAVDGHTIITSDPTNIVMKTPGNAGVVAFYTQNNAFLAQFQIDSGNNRSLNLSGGLQLNTNQANIESGTGVPVITRPVGSIFLRTDGAAGARLYVSAGSGAWNAVAGV